MFKDRRHAGEILAIKLKAKYPKVENGVVLALPRGGVVLGKIIAQKLALPLDVIVTRKIGAPENPEYAVAAVSEHELIISRRENPNQSYLKKEVAKERREIKRRLTVFRGPKPPVMIKNKNVFLIDDGLATGLTMEAAILEVRRQKAAKIVLGVPVAPPEIAQRLSRQVDDMQILLIEPMFFAVGQFYESFRQINDQEVKDLMQD